jgi:DmsE family decaheme c-type cytochrome
LAASVIVLALALAASAASDQQTGSPQAALASQTATLAGEARCIECHRQETAHYDATTHAKVFRLNPRNDNQRQGCEACHGPGSLHVRNATDKSLIIGFTKKWGTPLATQNGQCLTCHDGGNRLHWSSSVHDSNKVGCADCHNPMAKVSGSALQVRQSIAETCIQCHPQQRAEFRKRSHMPVLEGKMTCADCHNPHGTTTRPLLKADSVNEVCYSCHQERRGPVIWDHAPVRESCLNCHQPHGSNHEKLLVVARPYLCQQCHSPSGGHPGQFFRAGQTAGGGAGQSARIIEGSCQNCHSQVHGSNHPAGARFLR